jgi:hypothetical protein
LILLDKNKAEVPALRRLLLNQLLTLAVIQDLLERGRVRIDPITPNYEVLERELTGDGVADDVAHDFLSHTNPFRRPPMLDRVLEQLASKNILHVVESDGKKLYRLDDNRVLHDIIDHIKAAIADPSHSDRPTLCLVNFLYKHLALGRVLSLKGQVSALKAMRKTLSQREVLVAMGFLPRISPEQVATILEAASGVIDAVGEIADSHGDTQPSQIRGNARSPNDNRSDTLNPNSGAFKASRDNRSNQLNPNNPRYQG